MRTAQRRRLKHFVALLGAVVACSAGCAAGGGPLEAESSAEVCISSGPGESVAYGEMVVLPEHADEAVVLDALEKEGAEGAEFYILPLDGTTSQGSFSLDDPPEVWEQRQPAEGYVIHPGDSANIVAVFPPLGGSEIDSTELDIGYHEQSGRTYEVSSSMRVAVKSACF